MLDGSSYGVDVLVNMLDHFWQITLSLKKEVKGLKCRVTVDDDIFDQGGSIPEDSSRLC